VTHVALRQTIYVDPERHLVRFIDTARQSQPHVDIGNGPNAGVPVSRVGESPDDVLEDSTEYRYPTEAELLRDAPLAPSGKDLVESSARREEFSAAIANPVATTTVAGVSKSLYAVIVRAPGDVIVLTKGGAPRNRQDAHQVEIVGEPTRRYRKRPLAATRLMVVPGATGEPVDIERPREMNGQSFIVDGATSILIGPAPRRITVRVPVWKEDRSQSFPNPMGTPEPFVYRSKFVGYATFTTDRIFTMPTGFGNSTGGAYFPSDY